MPKRSDMSAILFAGGKSSRMGRDKALLPFGEFGSLSEYQYRKLQQVFENVYISAKEDKFDFDANIIYDKLNESSPMVALYSIFEQINAEEILILSVDMPMVTSKEISQLIQHWDSLEKKPEILISSNLRGDEPLFGIYSKKILPMIISLLGQKEHRLGRLTQLSDTEKYLFEDEDIFLNLNTPQDYKKSLAQIPLSSSSVTKSL